MADIIVTMGAIIDVDSSADSVVTMTGGRPGSILNKGAATIYINWTAGVVVRDNTAGDGKCYLASGDSIRIPQNCKRWTVATASSSAKVLFVED